MVDITLFANMNSKSHRFNKHRIKTLDKIIGDHGGVIPTYNVENLNMHLQNLHKKNPESICVDGGDGSLLTFFTLLFKYWPKDKKLPPFGIIPAGTWNVMSKEFKLKKRKEKKYLKLIKKSDSEDLFKQDIGLMKIVDENNLKTYGFSFGAGAIINFLDEYYKAKYLKTFKILQLATKFIGSAFIQGNFYHKLNEHKLFELSNNDGKKNKKNLLFLMAQTVKNIGLPKSKPFYKATHSQKFHVLGTSFNIDELVFSMLPTYFGKAYLLNSEKMVDVQTDNYKIVSLEGKFRYQVNGDFDFLEKKFETNWINLSHGRTIDVIKYIN